MGVGKRELEWLLLPLVASAGGGTRRDKNHLMWNPFVAIYYPHD